MMIPIPKLQEKTVEAESTFLAAAEVVEMKDRLGVFTCLEMIPYIIDSGASDTLMNIALLCKNSSIIAFADTNLDMRQLFKTKLQNSVNLLEKSSYFTPATEQIDSLMWPEHENFLVFKSKSCIISNEDCQAGIENAYI